MKEWKYLLRECAFELLEDGRCNARDVVALCKERHPDALENAGQDLIEATLNRYTKKLLTQTSKEDKQLQIPGIDFPPTIAVRDSENDFTYVRTQKATWEDLEAGEREREDNVEAASSSLFVYSASKKRLEPFMKDYPERTVEEAMALLAEAESNKVQNVSPVMTMQLQTFTPEGTPVDN